MRNIVNKKIIDKRMHLFIYIVNDDKIILNARLYVIKDIKIDVILENDVLELS